MIRSPRIDQATLPMFGPILSIARNTFTEAIRQPIFVVLLVMVGLVFVLGTATSAYTFSDDTLQMIVMGLSMLLIAGTLTAALVASGVVSREIESRTAMTVISKPIARPIFVIGKYLGVAGAIGVALWVWSLIYLLTIRHKVMAATADPLDGPVLAFGLGALFGAAAIAVWGNYFYNWVFTSTFVRVFAVTLTLAYVMVLLINKQWQFQPIGTEFNPDLAPITNYGEEKKSLWQVILALVLVFEAVWVLTAVAIAASTRLGQVMTLLVCVGMFGLGVVSDGLFGRFAGSNAAASVLYHITPNFQFFFLGDALTQRSQIAPSYLLTATGYAAAFIVAILALATALFQTRETG
jgi:hypothetical protein